MFVMPEHEEWPATQNKLLAALPVKDYARLIPHLEHTFIKYKELIYDSDTPIRFAYFPHDAIVSLLSVVETVASVEVGLVGSEGMVGASVLLGSTRSPTQAIVQTSGAALRIDAEILKREFRRSSTMQDLLLRYVNALLAESAQSAVCHHYHTPQERLCRWLLMVQDRSGTNEFKVTQQFIACMLGTRRATVTEAAQALQHQGLIDQSRGRVKILDRQGLKAAACSCYRKIREVFCNLNRA
jgi:CRP-like cAMP-binding protein